MNTRHTVLLVEDCSAARCRGGDEGARLALLLAREGHSMQRVRGSNRAVRRVSGSRRPDLLLWSADPDAAWATSLRAVKSSVEPGFLPVMLLPPACGGPAARVAGLRAGADDVLTHGCSDDELVARVEALLRIKVAQDALAQQKAELERQSITDPLTGLFNRRYFGYRLQQELERARRRGGPVSVLMLDVDRFKRVNDRYGHRTGDEALRRVSEVLQADLRRLDVCVRWGGEELAVILPSTGADGAMVVAGRVQRALRKRAMFQAVPIGASNGLPEMVRLTASIGVATSVDGSEEADALVHRADAGVYRAKSEGRDRICVAHSSDAAIRASSIAGGVLVPSLRRLVAAG